MKTKINIKKIEAFVVALILLAFFSGGWILFICSEISHQKQLTREINDQTLEILSQMHKRDSTFAAQSKDFELLPK